MNPVCGSPQSGMIVLGAYSISSAFENKRRDNVLTAIRHGGDYER